jgi:hypothetical protein
MLLLINVAQYGELGLFTQVLRRGILRTSPRMWCEAAAGSIMSVRKVVTRLGSGRDRKGGG